MLSAGAADIYYETPALTDTDPPAIRPSTIRKVQLSKILADKTLLKHAVQPVAAIRGSGEADSTSTNMARYSALSKLATATALITSSAETSICSAWFPEPKV